MGTAQSKIHTLDTISKRFQFLAENYPDKELFVFYKSEKRDAYTSQQLFQLAGKFANRLRHQYGFKRNDIIANTIPNSPERLITDLGIILAGCSSLNGTYALPYVEKPTIFTKFEENPVECKETSKRTENEIYGRK